MTIIQRTIKIFSNLSNMEDLKIEYSMITHKLISLTPTSQLEITHEETGSNFHIVTISLDRADVPAVKAWLQGAFPKFTVLTTILRSQRYNPYTQTTTITDTGTTF